MQKKTLLSVIVTGLILTGCDTSSKSNEVVVQPVVKEEPVITFIRDVVSCKLESGEGLKLEHNLNSKEYLFTLGSQNARLPEGEVEVYNMDKRDYGGDVSRHRRFNFSTEFGEVEVGTNWIVGEDDEKFVYITRDKNGDFFGGECIPETVTGAIDSTELYN